MLCLQSKSGQPQWRTTQLKIAKIGTPIGKVRVASIAEIDSVFFAPQNTDEKHDWLYSLGQLEDGKRVKSFCHSSLRLSTCASCVLDLCDRIDRALLITWNLSRLMPYPIYKRLQFFPRSAKNTAVDISVRTGCDGEIQSNPNSLFFN